MWVWIPRFAYKVNSSTKNFDVVFLVGTTDQYYDENGNLQIAKRCKSEDEVVDTSTGYTVHPAFTDETAINYRNGGWDKEITGIWVAKFMAGYASGNNDTEVVASSVYYTQATSQVASIERGESVDGQEKARNWLDGIYGEARTTIKYPVFQPLTYCMNYISYNDAYNVARVLTKDGNIYGLNEGTDSHLIKNSEWGAIAYLSQSKYGLNGVNIGKNDITLLSGNKERTSSRGQTGVDSVYGVSGCTTASEVESAASITKTISDINSTSGNLASNGVYTWNQKNGTGISSTGTIYGVYDLSGPVGEITSSYIANGNEKLKENASSFTYIGDILNTIGTKYATVYPYDSNSDNGANNYKTNILIYGDGIRETSTSGGGSTSTWYGDLNHYPSQNSPFFLRSAGYGRATGTGLFSFAFAGGANDYGRGFRVSLIIA